MTRTRLIVLATALALGLGTAVAAQAQTVGYNINSGDVWLDDRIGEVDTYGRRYRDPFVSEVVTLGAPRSLVVDLLDTRGWSPGDVYMACSIASVLGVGCARVVERYDRNPGRGWGRIAQDMGIKPGSAEFHALKRGTANTYSRWGYPVEIDSRTRIDWSDGPRGRGQGARGDRGDAQGGPPQRGPAQRGQGNQREDNRGPGNRGQNNEEDKGRGRRGPPGRGGN
jgi:hypothetical protein